MPFLFPDTQQKIQLNMELIAHFHITEQREALNTFKVSKALESLIALKTKPGMLTKLVWGVRQESIRDHLKTANRKFTPQKLTHSKLRFQ